MSVDINPGGNQTLRWFMEMLQLFAQDSIRVPRKYREQVIETKQLLRNDVSGLVSTILDFSIDAALVDYTLETNDKTLGDMLTNWLKNINKDLRGRIPTGITALAKEYFRERWKGSSHLILMLRWEEVNGWILPVNMWFLDGEDIIVNNGPQDSVNTLGEETYELLVNPKKNLKIPLVDDDDEQFFVQRPFDSWSTKYPTPYLIRRGLFRNMKFYDLLASKGEDIVRRAVEYMLLMKKGSEQLAAKGDTSYIYSPEDLKAERDNFAKFLAEKRRSPNHQTYTTQFDTELEHIIPEYERALKQSLYTALEKRMLAGLGMVDIVEGSASARKEALLNPKPLKREIESGIKDFAQLLNDVLATIVERNKAKHPKKTSISAIVRGGPVTAFFNDKEKAIIRLLYDRGLLSKRTTIELIGNVDYDVEVQRRESEKESKHDTIMYPPIIQNQEQHANDIDVNGDEIPPDKTGTEADNFNNSKLQVECELCEEKLNIAGQDNEKVDCSFCNEEMIYDGARHLLKRKKRKKRKRKDRYQADGKNPTVIFHNCKCGNEFDCTVLPEASMGTVKCPKCNENSQCTEEGNYEEVEVIYEEAPFKTNAELPKGIKSLPSAAQTLWRKVFNSVLKDVDNEVRAIRIAWAAVKKVYKKQGDKWIRRELADIDPLTERKLRVLEKQEKVFDKLLNDEEKDENI